MDRSQDRRNPKARRVSIDGFLGPQQRAPHRSDHVYTPPSTEHKHHSSGPNITRGVGHYPQTYLNPSTRQSDEPQPVNQSEFEPSTQTRRSRRRHQSKHKLLWRRLAASAVGLLFLVMVVSGVWVGWKFLKDTSKVFGGSIASNIGDLFGSTKVKGEDQGRINVLLAGDSADDPNHGGAQLTDSIMIASIDLKNNSGFLLSVPRDLWVNIPSLGHQKINAANDVANFSGSGYPNGGMGQLEQIVEQDLGIPIDYYALIDYTAFKDAVNAVGGISINIQSPDPRGLYDPNISVADGGPLKLPNGLVTLNGQTALNLARARGDPAPSGIPSYGFPQSDFDRTMHQRQMLVALKSKATTVGFITNPLKVGQLFDAIGNNVQTDLNLADVLRIIQLTKGVNANAIQSLSYSDSGTNPLLTGYLSANGQEALVPRAGIDNFSQIQAYYQQLTSSNAVVKEAATVVVLNGTNGNGVAKTAETALQAKGVDVTNIADASKIYSSTTIIDNSGGKDPATLSLLEGLYGKNVTTQQLETSIGSPTFIVIIGGSTSSTSSTTTQ